MPTATGHRKLLEQLEADGITTMFGNPGSSEEGLLDEISRFPKIRYILGLQEAALVLIANGYAVATQKPTAVSTAASVPATRSAAFIRRSASSARRWSSSARRASPTTRSTRTWRSTSSPSPGR
jgi:glyoxylate carboligase